jgi:hypothetical protein
MGAWALLGARVLLPLLPLLAAVAAAAQQFGGAATTMRLTASLDLAATPTTAFHHTWEASVGSSHAAMGLREDWRAHLRMAVRDCGFRGIRMHGIFDDDMSVVFPPCTFPPCKKHGASGGPRPQPTYSWFNVDSLYDFLINQLHIQPVVELSFMPQALAGCWPNPHGAEKRPFLRQFHIETTILLRRQARDKHKGNSFKRGIFCRQQVVQHDALRLRPALYGDSDAAGPRVTAALRLLQRSSGGRLRHLVQPGRRVCAAPRPAVRR